LSANLTLGLLQGYSSSARNAKDVLKIAREVLGAKIALAKKDNGGAIALLQSAVAVQDTLKYSEPEDWFFPVRESLGAALVMNGDNAGAEKVFREDLERHPRNPRSLFGLQQALKAQGKEYDAGFVQKQLQASWKGRNTQLKLVIWSESAGLQSGGSNSWSHISRIPQCMTGTHRLSFRTAADHPIRWGWFPPLTSG
jgi:hypothetical protein